MNFSSLLKRIARLEAEKAALLSENTQFLKERLHRAFEDPSSEFYAGEADE